MGLSVQVGVLAYLIETDPDGVEWMRASLDATNELIQANGLPAHLEPETLPSLDNRCSLEGYPYSFLHYLRRTYARRVVDLSWIATPLAKDQEPTDDPVLRSQYTKLNSHLLCHSDAEGFYLPIDFQSVLIDESERVSGGMVGSSFRLMKELIFVAPAILIHLDGGKLSDSEAQAINAGLENQSGLFIERIVWLSLYEAARLSIKHRTAISFG
jgi:hypothetical protein